MPVDYKLLTKILVTKSVNWPRIRFVSRPLVRDEVARLFSAVCGDRAHTQMRLGAAPASITTGRRVGQQASNLYSSLCSARRF